MTHPCHAFNGRLHKSITVYIMPIFLPSFLAIFELMTILGNSHRPCKHYLNIVNNSIYYVFALNTIFTNLYRPCNSLTIITNHPYFFKNFVTIFCGRCKTCLIWQILASIPVMHQCSQILAGRFHWNGTGICRHDQNLAEISGALIRALQVADEETISVDNQIIE